ncbi:MAG: dihydrodipicolinate synthase family protein, partial [Chitinophagaceae bacterium]|nr:dihydrodipicolinate synthase family protein [Rubrivivax sp.]
ALQLQLDKARAGFAAYPLIAAMKAVVAHFRADDAWLRVRPPLVALPDADRPGLLANLQKVDFSMPVL